MIEPPAKVETENMPSQIPASRGNDSTSMVGLGKPSLRRSRTTTAEEALPMLEKQHPSNTPVQQVSPIAAQHNDFNAMVSMINFLNKSNSHPRDIVSTRSDDSPVPPAPSPITPSLTPRPDHPRNTSEKEDSQDRSAAPYSPTSPIIVTKELLPEQKTLIRDWRERSFTAEQIHHLLSQRNESVPLSSVTAYLASSGPFPTAQSPSRNRPIPPTHSRSSSTTAATDPQIKTEPPSGESSPSPASLHPLLVSLQELPTQERIEELKKLQASLPVYIEVEERRLAKEVAEREEAEALERQKREKREQIEKLQRELEEISRQEKQRILDKGYGAWFPVL